MNLKNIYKSFLPHTVPVSLTEKVLAALAGGVSILLLSLALKYLPQNSYPLIMLSSMAASALLLFAMPHSPLAQPWNLLGGHMVSALAGRICFLFIPDSLIAASAAVGLAIFLMHYLNCLHPPGAATAITLVLGSAQFQSLDFRGVMIVVVVNATISLILALIINNLLPGRQYPMRHLAQQTPQPYPFIVLEQEDLENALIKMGGVIDISEDDLAQIYTYALQCAQDRNEKKL